MNERVVNGTWVDEIEQEETYVPSNECRDICTIIRAALDLEDTLRKFGELATYNIKVEETLGPEKADIYSRALSSARENLLEASEIIQELTTLRLKERDVWKNELEQEEEE